MKTMCPVVLFVMCSFVCSPLWAADDPTTSTDPDIDFEFTVTGTNKSELVPSNTDPTSERFSMATYTLKYNPTGEIFVVNVELRDFYERIADETFSRTTTRKMNFYLGGATDADVTFTMMDYTVVDLYNQPLTEIGRNIEMSQIRNFNGSPTTYGVSGVRDLSGSVYNWIIASEIGALVRSVYPQAFLQKAREQATQQVFVERGKCQSEMNFFLATFLEYIECEDASGCLETMVNMERVVIPHQCW